MLSFKFWTWRPTTSFFRFLPILIHRRNSKPDPSMQERRSSLDSFDMPITSSPIHDNDEPQSDAPSTAMNVFLFSLRTLGSISSNVPFGGILNSAIDPLLDILNRVDQKSLNERGLVQLASRIDMLSPIVSESKARDGQTFMKALQGEFVSIQSDLKQAQAQGKLAQFFNSDDNASAISRHNAALAQLIADSTFANVNEILKSIHELEAAKLEAVAPGRYDIDAIRGGTGGTGGKGNIGGAGGAGEGPDVELDTDPGLDVRVNSISGGMGGTGGEGVEVGGEGGIGKAPIVRFLRGRKK